jgi:hypothetical protein
METIINSKKILDIMSNGFKNKNVCCICGKKHSYPEYGRMKLVLKKQPGVFYPTIRNYQNQQTFVFKPCDNC